MRLFYSELCLIGGPVARNVESLKERGARNVELMLDGAGWDGFQLRMEELAASLRGRGLGYSVHVPVWDANLTSESSLLRAAVLDSYRRSIDFALLLGASHLVLHPGFCSDPHFDRSVARGRAAESLATLLEQAAPGGLPLLVENVGTRNNAIFDQDQYSSFLDPFPVGAGYVLDVGHAHIAGWDFETLLPALGGRLRALHLHDNDGSRDSHAPIGEGRVDWPRLLALLAAGGGEPDLVLEYNIGTELSRLAEGRAYLEAALPGRIEGAEAKGD